MAETENVFKKRPSAAASRKKLMGTLEKERAKNAAARAVNEKARAKADKPSSGTMSDKIKAQRTADGRPKVSPSRYDPMRITNPLQDASKAGKPNTTRAIVNAAGRVIGRVASPVSALIAMTTPAGEGSDQPKGPLMRGNAAKATDFNKAYQAMGRAKMDRPYDVKESPKFKNGRAVGKGEPHAAGGYGVVAFNTERTEGFGGRLKGAAPKPKLRPVVKAGKSKTRIAFEKEFAKKRAEAKRRGSADKGVFTFRGKRYNTKLAK